MKKKELHPFVTGLVCGLIIGMGIYFILEDITTLTGGRWINVKEQIANQMVVENINKSCYDWVDLGIKESELKHQGLGGWAGVTEVITSNYTGKNNTEHFGMVRISWRDFADVAGVVLSVPKNKELVIKINLFDKHYRVGNPDFEPQENFIEISSDGVNFKRIGKFKLLNERKWKTYKIRLNKDYVQGDKLYLLINASLNINEKGHYGLRVNWIEVC